MLDEMVDTILSELIPFVIPRNGDHLLILGWTEKLRTLNWSRWSRVSVFNLSEKSFLIDPPCVLVKIIPEGVTSILVIGKEGCHFLADKKIEAEIPTTILVRGLNNIAAIENERFLIRMAIPIFGRPLLWSKPGFDDWLHHASPRGRFDKYWLNIQRILLPLFLGKYVLIVAADKQASFVGKLLSKHLIKDRLWQHTKTKMMIVMGDDKIVKAPLRAASEIKLTQSLENIQALTKKYRENPVIACFPKNIFKWQDNGSVAYVEDRLTGVTAYQIANSSQDKLKVFKAALGFLEKWYSKNKQRISIDDNVYKKYWSIPLEPLGKYLEKNGKSEFWFDLNDAMYKRLVNIEIPLIPLHGDFWLNNIIVDESTLQINGVIDWDNAQEIGLPLLDFYHLITWRTDRFRQDFSPSMLKQNLYRQQGLLAMSIEQHCKNIKLPYDVSGHLYIRYWLMELAKRTDEPLSFNRIFRGLRIISKYCHDRKY